MVRLLFSRCFEYSCAMCSSAIIRFCLFLLSAPRSVSIYGTASELV